MPDYPGRHRFGSGQALLDEHDGPFMRIGGGVAGHGDKIVRCPWIDLQVAWISGGQPAHVHEEAVLEQRIFGTDKEQCRAWASQIGIEWGSEERREGKEWVRT